MAERRGRASAAAEQAAAGPWLTPAALLLPGMDFYANQSLFGVPLVADWANLTAEERRFHQILRVMQEVERPALRQLSLQGSLLIGAFFVLATVCGIVGNVTVIIAVALDRTMRRSAMNLLLLNLAVADVCNLLTSSLEWSPAMIFGFPAWAFPAALCPLTRYLECAFLFASILTQLTVCVER